MATILIIGTALLGLYMAWNIGANDVANSMADAVGSKSLSVRQAVIAAGLCNFAGAVLVGGHVTDTVRKGIVNPCTIAGSLNVSEAEAAAVVAIGMAAALLSAGIWLNFSSLLGMPVSTTHAIVGGVAGFGIVAGGWSVVNWGKMGQIVASWFISPVAGCVCAFIVFKLLGRFVLWRKQPVRAARYGVPVIVFFVTAVVTLATLYKGLKHVAGESVLFTGLGASLTSLGLGALLALGSAVLVRRYLRGKDSRPVGEQLGIVERAFAPVVAATSCTVAFAHGANDVANSVGPLAAVVHMLQAGTVIMKVAVPFWVLALGGAGIVIGLATYGYRVMYTVGRRITQLTPSRGVAADIAGTLVILICCRLKLPVSTTHTLVGAIFGVGLARGLGAVNKGVMRNIFGSWIITVPAAAVLSILLFLAGRWILLDLFTQAVRSSAGTFQP